jgi:hypothetical protein
MSDSIAHTDKKAELIEGELWFCDAEARVKASDLSEEDLDAWTEACGVAEIAGKTISGVVAGEVSGAWGREPTALLVFSDGTVHGFVLAGDE